MKLSGVSPISVAFLPLLAIAAVLAFLLATPDSTVQAANNYNITFTTVYCNALPNTPPFSTAGIGGNPACTNPIPAANAPMTTTVKMNIPTGHLNFGFITTFFPPDATITPGSSIPIGDVTGGLESSATLGVGNGACQTAVPVPFILHNVALPDARAGTTVIAGQADLGQTIVNFPGGQQPVRFDDANSNGVWDPGEAVYIDADSSGTVSTGDTAIAGSAPLGTTIIDFPGGQQPVRFHDINSNGAWDPGDTVFIDGDNNGTVSTSDTRITGNPRASTNIYIPLAEGTSSGDTNVPNPEGGTIATVTTGRFENGVTDADTDNVADGTSLAIQEYPDWLLDLFDPDWLPIDPAIDGPDADPGVLNPNNGPLKPVVPLAVYGSLTQPVPASVDWVPLYFVVFDKGALPAGGFAAPSPFATHIASLGYPSVALLTDTSEVAADVSLITDFCGPLVTNTMLLGNTIPSNTVRATTPPAGSGRQGTHLVLNYTFSLRDLDADGFENAFDTCPKVANVDDARTTAGVDGDMLDPACDPDPNVNEAGGPIQCPGQFLPQTQPGDIDGDCFTNAQDNCPQTANGRKAENPAWDNQRDGEAFGTYAAAAPDGGPKTDAIGDACDAGSATFTQNGVPTTVTLSGSVANGHWHTRGIVNPACIGGVDADADGWCAATTGEDDTDANITPPLSLSPPDADGDGISVWIETAVGTDDSKDCAATAASNDEPVDAYAYDTNDDQFVNISDVNSLRPPVFNLLQGKGANPNYTPRKDFNADGFINISDVNALRPPVFNLLTPCTQGGPTPQQ